MPEWGVDGSPHSPERSQVRLVAGLLLLILAVAVLLLLYGQKLDLAGPSSPFTLSAVALAAGGGLWLLARGQLRLAVLIVNICFVAAAAGPLLLFGLDAAECLLLLLVPLALAGLALNRAYLLYTVLTITAIFAATLLLQQYGLTRAEPESQRRLLLVTAQFLTVLVIHALILDRFGQTTTAALANSRQRESELSAEISRRRETERELNDQRNFAEAIIDSLPGVFFVLDRDLRLVRANAAMQRLGSDAGERELVGQTVTSYLTEGQLPGFRAAVQRLLDEGQLHATIPVDTVDRKAVPFQFRTRTFPMKDEAFIVGLGFDISQIVEAERDIRTLNLHLEKRIEQLTAFHMIDAAISRGSGPADTIRVILEQVTLRLGIDAAAIQRFERNTGTLYWERGIGFRQADGPLQLVEVGLGEGITGQAARQRAPVYVNDAEQLQNKFLNWDHIEPEGFLFCAAVPLIANGELEGVLTLFHRSAFEPDDDWKEFLDALASQAALSLSGTRMLSDLQQSNAELRAAYDRTIEGWSRALDLRDEETEGHSQRVTELTVRLAQRMSVAPERLEHIRRGALLHDIGKMGVPDSILLKPGRLTAEERSIMEQHPVYALQLLAPIPFLQPALAIPYSHHENWDGSGYPDGLAGEAIPLEARIFAVVDVYDALTNDRPYREAWSAASALDYIVEQAGSKFDPEVVAEFMAMMRETDS